MLSGSAPLGRPPRPVADAPAVEAEAVAKAWLLELVAGSSLSASGTLPVGELAAEGPELAAALLGALSSDAGLKALRPGGSAHACATRAGALAGARDAAAVVAAVEALRSGAWRSLASALPAEPDPALIADLGHRLAHVCACIAQAALRSDDAGALERHVRNGSPFVFLALEVEDLERLAAVEGDDGLAADLEAAERDMIAALGPGDELRPDRVGRWTVVAAGLDPVAGRELAERLSQAFAVRAPLRHGVPLALSAGLAAYPGDSTDVEGLVAHADVGLFAARAAGVPVV